MRYDHTANTRRPLFYIDVLLITLFCISLFSILLGAFPFITPDEGRYSEVAREMLARHNFITPSIDGIPFLDKPALYYWVQSFFIKLFGIHEWSLRLWPALMGTLGCVATYITGQRLFSRLTGWCGALILGTSLFYYSMSHFADMDLMIAVLISCSLYAFLIGLNTTTPNAKYDFWLAYLFGGLGFFTKGLIAIAFPALIFLAYATIHNRWSDFKRIRLGSGLLIILAINLPWFILVQKHNPDFLHYFFINQQFERYVGHQFNDHAGAWLYPTIITVGVLPWSLFLIGALYHTSKKLLGRIQLEPIQTFLWLWVVLITIFFSIPASKTVGYILPVFPAAALLTAVYIVKLWQQRSPWWTRLLLWNVTLFSAFCIILFFLPAYNLKALTHYQTYLNIYSAIFLIAALVLFIFRHTRMPAFGALVIIALVINLTGARFVANDGQQYFIKTTKPLALFLKDHNNSNTIITTYQSYYQDLPLYLQHDVIITDNLLDPRWTSHRDNWEHELSEGFKNGPYRKLIWSEQQLAHAWHHQRVFIVCPPWKIGILGQFLKSPQPVIIKQFKNIAVISQA